MLAFGLADNYTAAACARLVGGFFNCSFTCGAAPLLPCMPGAGIIDAYSCNKAFSNTA